MLHTKPSYSLLQMRHTEMPGKETRTPWGLISGPGRIYNDYVTSNASMYTMLTANIY
jgi:hypothetical protein